MCDFVNLYLYQFWHIFISILSILVSWNVFVAVFSVRTYDKIAIDKSIHFTLMKSFARCKSRISKWNAQMHICNMQSVLFPQINFYPTAIHHITIVSKEIVYTINSNIVISLFGSFYVAAVAVAVAFWIFERNAKRCNKCDWRKKQIDNLKYFKRCFAN